MADSYLRITKSDGISIVHLPEELTSAGIVASFRDAWLKLVDDGQLRFLVDFNNVRRFGSEATAVLIRVVQRLRLKGGDLKLCSMSEHVQEIFNICNLLPAVFELYESAAAGLDAFRNAND